MRVSEIHVKQIRVNQELGVVLKKCSLEKKYIKVGVIFKTMQYE